MNVKNFIICGIVGGIADFLLGWLLWGKLFKDCFPPHNEEDMNMLLIFLGCMTFGFFLSYVCTAWATITSAAGGMKSGLVLALFLGLYANFFGHSMELQPDYQMMAIDIALMLVCGAVVGAIVGMLNGKMK